MSNQSSSKGTIAYEGYGVVCIIVELKLDRRSEFSAFAKDSLGSDSNRVEALLPELSFGLNAVGFSRSTLEAT